MFLVFKMKNFLLHLAEWIVIWSLSSCLLQLLQLEQSVQLL